MVNFIQVVIARTIKVLKHDPVGATTGSDSSTFFMQIEIRDTRRKEMFRMDDEYLNGYAKLCGINATGVYISLCRHADRGQESWPSIELIQTELGLGSNNTVLKAIKALEKWGIIHVVRSKNEKTKRQNPNIYVLADKQTWEPKPSAPRAPRAECILEAEPSAFTHQKPSAPRALEGSPGWKVTHRRAKVTSLAPETDPVTGENLGFTRNL